MNLNVLNFKQSRFLAMLVSTCVTVALTSCSTVTTDQYEATAQSTLTWQVKYSIDFANDKNPRFEEFASNSLLSQNGEKPKDAGN